MANYHCIWAWMRCSGAAFIKYEVVGWLQTLIFFPQWNFMIFFSSQKLIYHKKKGDLPYSERNHNVAVILFFTYLQEHWPVFCHENSRSQCIKLFTEFWILQTVLCHKNEKATQGHHTDNTTNIIWSSQEITAAEKKELYIWEDSCQWNVELICK